MPGKFLTTLRTEFVDGNYWKLTESLSYAVNGDSDVIAVPAGFYTDFASVPCVARWFIPKSGEYDPAAALHDYLYFSKTRSRAECDGIFCEAMKSLNVSFLKGEAMYLALRAFGWYAWHFSHDPYNKR